MADSKDYTVFIRNFDSKQVTHDILLELFTQAGPVQDLKLKEDFAFLEFEDQESVIYSCNLLNDTLLFGIPLQVKPRNGSVWEKTELFKFPSQTNESFNNNNNSFNNNSSFNEHDYRSNRSFSGGSGIHSDSDHRPMSSGRSHNYSEQQQDFRHNNSNIYGNNTGHVNTTNSRGNLRNSFPQQREQHHHESSDYRFGTSSSNRENQYQQHHDYRQNYQQQQEYQDQYQHYPQQHHYPEHHPQQYHHNSGYYESNLSNSAPARSVRSSQQQHHQYPQQQHHQYPQQQQQQYPQQQQWGSRARDKFY